MEFERVIWRKLETKCPPHAQIPGRQSHSTVPFNRKLYIFGGCFSFNRIKKVRECTNQVVELCTETGLLTLVITKGISVSVRKSHTAVAYKQSMVVFGGISETSHIHDNMLVYNFKA